MISNAYKISALNLPLSYCPKLSIFFNKIFLFCILKKQFIQQNMPDPDLT